MMLRAILLFDSLAQRAVKRGVSVERIRSAGCRVTISRMARMDNSGFEERMSAVMEEIKKEMGNLR
ncbi:MAG TPA: hypothetical protein ENK47_04680 [Euryarchaeota archaeon]|nr:hypothetical protein [Euryarchaeota archaeon]